MSSVVGFSTKEFDKLVGEFRLTLEATTDPSMIVESLKELISFFNNLECSLTDAYYAFKSLMQVKHLAAIRHCELDEGVKAYKDAVARRNTPIPNWPAVSTVGGVIKTVTLYQ
jgi:hypothetical protein